MRFVRGSFAVQTNFPGIPRPAGGSGSGGEEKRRGSSSRTSSRVRAPKGERPNRCSEPRGCRPERTPKPNEPRVTEPVHEPVRQFAREPWVVDARRAPGGDGGALAGGPPSQGGLGRSPAPQEARRRRRFFGAFLTDFHEVLLLFWDQLKPKNGYKYSHTSC